MNAHELIAAYVDDVVRHVERKRRNDVGVELRTLLEDELQGLAEGAGRPADMEMAMDLLRRFGRPEDAALRYRKPGFPIVEPADGPAFAKLSAIGMAAIWIVGLVATFRDGGGPERLAHWWMTFGLGAFWWPGFLVVCAGIAAWLRRRFPVEGEWQPRLIDRDRVNRPLWVLLIAASTLGTIWLIAPAQFAEQLTGGRLASEFYASLVYDATFRAWRLPLLLMLIVVHLMLYAVLVAQGRWQRLTRRMDIVLSAAVGGLLFWSIATGPIFQRESSDGLARLIIALIVLIVMWDIAAKIYREQARVRLPVVVKRA